MFMRSVSYLTIEDYRKSESGDARDFILQKLKKEMVEFLEEESQLTEKKISKGLEKKTIDKLTENIHQLPGSDEKLDRDNVRIHIPKSGNVLGSVFTIGDSNKGYPFFAGSLGEVLRKKFKSTSNIFSLSDYDFVSEYMLYRITYRIAKNELIQIADELEDDKMKCDYALSEADKLKTYRRVMENAEPITIIDTIETKNNYTYREYELRNFCSILRMNICLLKGWSDNVSVHRYYHVQETFPTILIFIINEGYVGQEGIYTDVKYLPGAVTFKGRVKYYLDPEKDEMIIYQLLKYDVTNNARIMEMNYESYLENLKRGTLTQTEITELEDISVPEYGDLEKLLSDKSDGDQITDIIDGLELA